MSVSESCVNVWDWLSDLHLEHYTEAFQSAGIATLQQCCDLNSEQLEQMGIALPGHRKRILASLNKTQVRCHTDTSTLQPDIGLTEVLQGDGLNSEDDVERDANILKPIPRGRAKPAPKKRKGPREKTELSGETTCIDGKEDERTEGLGEKLEKPLPKERTKIHFVAPNSLLPPVPPRNTPNCPPQPFTNMPCLSHLPQIHLNSDAESLPQQSHVQLRGSDPLQATSTAVTQNASSIIHKNAPPLPPKVFVGSKNAPPVPQRSLGLRPMSRSFLTKTEPPELEKDKPHIRACIGTTQTQGLAQQQAQPTPKLPLLPHGSRLDSIDLNADDYEDPDPVFSSVDQVNLNEGGMSLSLPRQSEKRCHSFCSDDGLLETDDQLWQDDGQQGSVYMQDNGPLPPSVKEESSHLSTVIKMGWLDKNPPQGGLHYQRRWVKLDVDYLRYYGNQREAYSKGFVSTAFITNVGSIGELKLEVVTSNRTFIFKADTEAERNNWVTVLQDVTRGRQSGSTMSPISSLNPEYQGYLELRGIRSKLYTVVASDKVFLYKSIEDYRIGVGITAIDMNVGNIRDKERRSFDLNTPYRTFSFVAESEQHREKWVNAMTHSIGEALSNSEVAERIWEEPSNSCCADCGAYKPEWAAINLCVVVCKRCAGEHRGLGPSISKVRSLKMDKKVWTEELIQVFLVLGNERVNSFWAANIPPSEALMHSSCSEDRRHFITSKYRHGKYRKYHALYGNQKELNNALCINVQCSDLLETLSLIFCGADVNCSTGMPTWPTPHSLAIAHSQLLQAELISHNLNTELPQSEVHKFMEPVHYPPAPCVSHNGFLFKTASMARAVTERKAREEFSRRWCTLNDGTFSYYESDKNANPNGAIKASEIVCLAVDTPEKHGYDFTFELYSGSERLYLFGTDDPETHKQWVKSIAKTFIPVTAEPLLRLDFQRLGRLKCKDGLNLQTSKVGWFALVGSTLHVYLVDSQGEEIRLRKLNELSIQQDNEVLVLVERGRTLYIEGERKLDFTGWCSAIQAAAGRCGDTLSEQQLTETDIPVIVHSCIDYITQSGLTSEGIYRKSGVNSRVAAVCERFRSDARSLRLKEGEHQVDDVSNALKRFFRELEEGLFTSEDASTWLSVAGMESQREKISQYKLLLNKLPRVNKATLQALINHLYCVQRFSELNQMNLHNLAIVFGPTLFQTDGKDYTAGRAVEDLIEHYTLIFEVDEQQLKKQIEEIQVIIEVRQKLSVKLPGTEPGGHFICTVYLEKKEDTAEQHVKIPAAMTAAELTCEVLDRRNIPVNDKEYWSCWEVCEKEEMERPLHYQERVLPILHSFGTDSNLLIKKDQEMDSMLVYLASKVDPSKHGMVKFREERSILGLGGFHDRYFILNFTSLRMYKEVRSNRPEREWPVKSLKVYMGIKKKVRPPTCWGLTVVCESKKPERQQWYFCCENQSEMREWYATFLSIQHNSDVWPQDGLQQMPVSRMLPDTRHGNVSLIPLRGSENEMRNSVAAFTQDPLALFRDVR
ncbi:arf-GAP with Rho-GAP domain, ANK repeat and PH domain-containing protein 1 isoform X2 [Gouania willdenowi]|uniref:ArfGAP with RhoGAP domain, ankyrin repeat and PH domain 1 n=1 Tax=Gouania willdenowi TaxID=441366 RepID=A0A8C5F112_GOUWI|nr:arf-GAP with Rho-GAP domain, ANK repeat and PH domain-containing protein 1 isoform X2 [Gouania willdenowi]